MSEAQESCEDQAITSPEADEDHGTDALSPVRSFDSGFDYLEPVISEGEPKYEGKGKGRSESFSHLPTTVPSTPSTARSTRPNSEIPDTSAPSTAPSTRPNSELPGAPGLSTAPSTGPVSQAQDDKAPRIALATKADDRAQADPEPGTADGASSITEEKDDSAGIAAQGDPGPSTDQAESAAMATQGDPEPSNDQAESAAMATQGDPGPSDDQAESAAMAAQGDPGPSTDQAESVSATGQGDSAAISARDGTPRLTVQGGSEPIERQDNVPTGPTFLGSGSNSDPAIEPTGPPNSLTPTPTAKDEPLEKESTSQVLNTEESGPNPAEPQTPSTPPQVDEGASGTQANQPQKLDAVEGQDLESKQTQEEQATTESRRVELGGSDEIPDTRRSNEDDRILPITPTPIARLSSPHHRDAITPKSILKKTTGTAAEARMAEEDRFGPDGVSEARDPRGGTKLFWGTIANYKATRHRKKLEDEVLDLLHTETESGAGTPRLAMEMNAISGGDNSDGESEEKARRNCSLRCNLL